MMTILEVCVDSLASARAAIRGGADRLELCSALSIGGLSPYPELLRQIRSESNIPIRCLMRPRAGDFLYENWEINLMAAQMRSLKDAGADGFVIGCLDACGNLDASAMAPLLDAAAGGGLTLHRCIDISSDPLACYLAAKELGFDTVLTSGAASGCMEGVSTLRQLYSLKKNTNGPEVLIGSGVNAAVIRTIRTILPDAGAFHMSGKTLIPSRMVFRREGIPMGIPGFDEWHIPQTSEDAVREAKEALQ